MKSTNESAAPSATPRAIRRRADRSLFSGGDAGPLLHFENPDVLAFVRAAVEAQLQPATSLDRIFTEFAIRGIWRAIRNGSLEAAAIDVEMGDHHAAIESRWGDIDPLSACHLSMRDPFTRNAIRPYAQMESDAVRAFQQTASLLNSRQ